MDHEDPSSRETTPRHNNTALAASKGVSEEPSKQQPEDRFPIVGIGASAGGLAALKQFFAEVPNDSGLAYVIVVHLSPEHKSHLAELLQPHIRMPVQQVMETVQLEPNRVFVIPPNANLDTIDTHLRLSELEERRIERAPIDHFFRTLAKTHDGDSIGVILTGTGSDGTLGLREIKQAGGFCLVQDPTEAEYSSMPQSAISTGLVDLVLPVGAIPKAILNFIHIRPQVPELVEDEELEGEVQQLLHKVFSQLRSRTGRDFNRYKRSTMLRRIQRRMQLCRIERMAEYVELLRKEPEEVRVLGDDLLITVTNFFRDPEVFRTLEQKVIPQLFDARKVTDTIRIWSVGCATGEEAYSLAILLLEEAARRDEAPRIQIFASDLHERSLTKGRDGVYPGDIETDVSAERLRRFFAKENGSYRLRKEVRELVVFAPHNLLGDPPFSRIDLISCRNLLIYLQRTAQREVIDLFHYALRPEGLLILGTAETIDSGDLFRLEDKKCCLYRKRNVPVPEPRLPVFPLARTGFPDQAEHPVPTGEIGSYHALHLRMLQHSGPASALVSPEDSVVHLSGDAGRYLVHPAGEMTSNLFKLVRPELRFELRAVVQEARKHGRSACSNPVTISFDSHKRLVHLRVQPARKEDSHGFMLILFEERPVEASDSLVAAAEPGEADRGEQDTRVRVLEAELELTQQRLQAIVEEYETSQEEMKASNEELQSANEELRSTMEELETSKEELQSINEELQTVNQENRHRVEELSQLSSDLNNLFAATDIATLFLDRELRILRFTPKIHELFNVRMTDRGRPISDFTHRLGSENLITDAQRVIAKLVPIERELTDEAGRWYLTRLLPYRSVDDRIEGVVITFVDITDRKRAEEQLRESEARHAFLVQLHDRIRPLSDPLEIQACTSRLLGSYLRVHRVGYTEPDGTDLITRPGYLDAVAPLPERFPHPSLSPRLLEASRRGEIMAVNDVRTDARITDSERPVLQTAEIAALVSVLLFKGGEWVATFNVHSAVPRQWSPAEIVLIREVAERGWDAVERARAEEGLRRSEARFRAFTDATSDMIYRMSPDWAEMRHFQGHSSIVDTLESSDAWLSKYILPEDQPAVRAAIENAIRTRSIFELEHRIYRTDGSVGWVYSRAIPMLDAEGNITEWFGTASDVTRRKRIADELEEASRRKTEFLAMLAHELRNPLAPIRTGLDVLKSANGDRQKVSEVCTTLQRQTEQLVTLVDDLLDMSRITRGKLELRKHRVLLSDVISSAVEASRPFIDEAGHELSVRIPNEPLVLLADAHRLAQVVSNLLSNAAKYTPDGGRIWLSVERNNGDVILSVRDTGIGIPVEMQERIFEMFAQIERPEADSGLGIGLTLVKSLVEMHGGQIAVQSEGENQGTTVTIVLPVVVEGPPDQPESRSEESVDITGLRILVTDDSKPAATMLSMALKNLGNEVRVAHNGKEAIEIAAEFQPDVIVMDIGMPVMNGYEAARQIRQQPWGREITLVALTGWGQETDKQRTRDAGFDYHLVKPIETADLRRVLAASQ